MWTIDDDAITPFSNLVSNFTWEARESEREREKGRERERKRGVRYWTEYK